MRYASIVGTGAAKRGAKASVLKGGRRKTAAGRTGESVHALESNATQPQDNGKTEARGLASSVTGKLEINSSNEFECSQRQGCSGRDEIATGGDVAAIQAQLGGYRAKQRHSNGYNSRGKPHTRVSDRSREATET